MLSNVHDALVSELYAAGVYVPSTRGITPAGDPAPFSLAFLGLPYSEATLLALAYDYEQATMLRYVPELMTTLPPALAAQAAAIAAAAA